MTERNGFERVRDFVVTQCRQAPGGVARITTAEIGQAAGISRQTAHDHLQTLIDIGILAVVRRSVYSLNIVQNIPARALQPDVDLTETLQRPDKNLTNRQVDAAFLPPEPDVDLTETLQGPDKDLTNCPNKNIQEKEKEQEEILGDVFGRKYFWGVGPGCGILREGIPVTTDDLDDFIDWPHPVVLNVTKYIGKVFNTKEYRWSPNLTKRLVFGVIYGMAGFSREELRGHAVFARECVIRHGMADAAIKNNDCFAFKDNPHPKRTWQIVSWYVNERFEEHGIKATPCELSHRQRSALRAKQLRERPTLPGFEAETPPTRSPPAVQETEQSSRVDFNTAYWEQVAKRNPTLYQKLIETESGITLPAGMAAARGP